MVAMGTSCKIFEGSDFLCYIYCLFLDQEVGIYLFNFDIVAFFKPKKI